MTRIEGNELSLGAGIGSIDAEFDPDPDTPFSGGDGGDGAGLVPILGTYGVLSVTEDLKLGLGLFSVSGAALDYDDGWAGRYQVNEITILTVSANPTIAYRVSDWLSIGGGPMFTYGDLEFKLAVPPGGAGRGKLEGDDIAVGFTLGALVELSPQTRIGVSYLSEQNLEFEGDLEVEPLGLDLGTDTDLDLAQLVRVGAYHAFNDWWAVLGTVGWEDWSTLSTCSSPRRRFRATGTTPTTTALACTTIRPSNGCCRPVLPTTHRRSTAKTAPPTCRSTGSCAMPSARSTRSAKP
jgi:long-chain fatty acid transport protein